MDDEHHALFQDRVVLDRDVARRDGARAHAMAAPVHVGRMVVFFVVPGVDQNGIDRAGDLRNRGAGTDLPDPRGPLESIRKLSLAPCSLE